MDLVVFLFGIVLGLVISLVVIGASLYTLLSHTVPANEMRMFVKELKATLRTIRLRRTRKNQVKK